MLDASGVFCDALNVTVPVEEWDAIGEDLRGVFNAAALELQHRDDKSQRWRTPCLGGLVRLERLGHARVVQVTASGAALARLRFVRLFGEYLRVIAQRPHKVTRLDATLDVERPAPAAIAAMRDLGRAGGVSLTRKAVPSDAVEFWERVRPDGLLSGTLYLHKKADVSLVVYDKRLERYDKTSAEWEDLPERVRYELRVTNGLPTLADAYDPAPLFYQHMSPSIFPRPPGLPERACEGLGFDLGPRPSPPLPAARLKARVEASVDLGELVDLARRDGAGGVEFLVSLVRRRYASAEGSSQGS